MQDRAYLVPAQCRYGAEGVLQQQQMPARLEHSGHLIQGSLGLLKDAQTERVHQAIEAGLGEWQLRDIACSLDGMVSMDAGNQEVAVMAARWTVTVDDDNGFSAGQPLFGDLSPNSADKVLLLVLHAC